MDLEAVLSDAGWPSSEQRPAITVEPAVYLSMDSRCSLLSAEFDALSDNNSSSSGTRQTAFLLLGLY